MSKTVTDQDLEHRIEQKMIEMYGDPDDGLTLKKSFVAELWRRMARPQKFTPMAVVAKKYGLG
ncbi:MAG: hypothetical protein AAB947_00870 [Patescibacteria group bacterium]